MTFRTLCRMHALVCLWALALALMLQGCQQRDPAAMMQAARQSRGQGDVKAAVIELKNVLQHDQAHRAARVMLGELYLEQGNAPSAEKELARALALGADSGKVTLMLARALLAQGKYERVLADISEHAAPAQRPALLAARATALFGLGKTEEARAVLAEAARLGPAAPEPLLGLARLALSDNQPDIAQLHLRRALAASPAHIDSLRLQADLLRAEGKFDAALANQQAILGQQPHNVQALVDVAGLQMDAGRLGEARAALARARAASGASLAILYTEALLDYRERKLAAALEKTQRVLRTAPGHAPALLLAGTLHGALGAHQQAAHHLRAFLRQHPRHPHASKRLAAVQLQQQLPAEALQLITPLLERHPDDVELLALAGEAHLHLHQFSAAAGHFERASALRPGEASLRTGLALGFMGSGHHARALAELERAASMERDPSHTGVLLVMSYMKAGQPDKAMNALAAMETKGRTALLHNLRGGILLSQNQPARARASFEQALVLDPAYVPALTNLAQLDRLEQRTADTGKRYQVALSHAPRSTAVMEALAGLALAAQRPADAVKWMERATAVQPDALALSIRAALTYLRAGQGPRAVDLAARLVAAHPASAEALQLLAQASAATGQYTRAEHAYTRLQVMSPASALPWLQLGHLHLAQHRPEAAEAALRKALERDAGLAEARITLVNVLLRKDAFDEALALAMAAQKLAPSAPGGYKLAGDIHAAQGKHAAAVKAYERAFQLRPGGPALVQLATALARHGRQREADARVLAWLEAHPADLPTRLHHASSLLVRNEPRQAAAQYEAVLRAAPRNVAALNDLAWSYHLTGERKALDMALRAYQLAPGNPAVMNTLGWIYLQQGQPVRALPLLRRASILAPHAAEIHYHLGAALAGAGDKAGARAALENALRVPGHFSQREQARQLLARL